MQWDREGWVRHEVGQRRLGERCDETEKAGCDM